MPRRDLSLSAYPSFARLSILTAGIWLSACVAPVRQMNPPPQLVNVRGTVFDSLTRTPLSGARITLTAADSVGSTGATATTDANGAFGMSLRSGTWLAQVEHPRVDSLGVALPPSRVTVPRVAAFVLDFATPSPATITGALCGWSLHDDDVALVGFVRNAATRKGLDSATVFVKWANLTLSRRGFTRSTETHETRTDRDGRYVICGVPPGAVVLSWAARESATTGAVLVTLTQAPARLDLTLDISARPSRGSIDLEPDSSGTNLFPTSTGNVRYRLIVHDLSGRPVTNARVRVLGRSAIRSDDAGAVILDSIASGTQTFEILAIGYQPERRMVDVAVDREPTDTVVLASLRSVLDTVRITAGRDPSGFELRRSAGVGEFITAADVERENPVRTTVLLRTRDGVRLTFDRNGFPFIEVTTLDTSCRPLVLIDGFPPGPAPAMPGEATLDWIIHPDEIGGVELYTTPARIPPELTRFAFGQTCAVIAFWTRQKLGLPRAGQMKP